MTEDTESKLITMSPFLFFLFLTCLLIQIRVAWNP